MNNIEFLNNSMYYTTRKNYFYGCLITKNVSIPITLLNDYFQEYRSMLFFYYLEIYIL